MSESVFSYPKVVAIDANFLVAVISNETTAEVRAQIDFFIQQIEKQKCKIIIPMPVVAEYLVRADTAGVESLDKLEKKTYIKLSSFDRAAAFECSLIDGAMVNMGDKKDGSSSAWQKIKIDRQIVAIAKSNGAGMLISRDADVKKSAARVGMQCLSIEDLPLPPGASQKVFEFQGDPSAAPLQ